MYEEQSKNIGIIQLRRAALLRLNPKNWQELFAEIVTELSTDLKNMKPVDNYEYFRTESRHYGYIALCLELAIRMLDVGRHQKVISDIAQGGFFLSIYVSLL